MISVTGSQKTLNKQAQRSRRLEVAGSWAVFYTLDIVSYCVDISDLMHRRIYLVFDTQINDSSMSLQVLLLNAESVGGGHH